MKRIAIHSAPRSGSTWLGAIFDSHPEVAYRFQPLFSYEFKGRLNENSSKLEVLNFFNEIGSSEDEFINQIKGKKEGVIPNFLKEKPTHIVYKEVRYHHILKNMLESDNDLKIVGMIRNPLSVLNSWFRAPKEFRADLAWDIQKEWRFAQLKNIDKIEEFNGYEKWKEVTLLFETLERDYKNQFIIVSYENLVENTLEEVGRLFNFTGLELKDQTREFITNEGNRNDSNAYSVFKNKQSPVLKQYSLPENIVAEIENDMLSCGLEKYLK